MYFFFFIIIQSETHNHLLQGQLSIVPVDPSQDLEVPEI